MENRQQQDNDDLGLYSDVTENTNETNNIQQNTISNPQEDNQEKIYEADIKAENAVQYMASIMKCLCLREPEKGKLFFKNLQDDNPQIMFLIKKNESEFKKLLYSPKTEEDVKIFKKFYKGQLKEEKVESSNQNQSQVNSNDDEENIRKLMEFGFTYKNSKDAYLSCDKIFDLALNFLLDNN
jgi:hypothetical protein